MASAFVSHLLGKDADAQPTKPAPGSFAEKLGGAMSALGKKAEIVDYTESYVLNSNKCFAVFS